MFLVSIILLLLRRETLVERGFHQSDAEHA